MQVDNIMPASIYIPIIGNNITSDFVKKCFHEKLVGKVDHVDFVINKKKLRREAFVHFSEWYNSEEADRIKNLFDNYNEIGKDGTKFIYNDKLNFWPILRNKNPLEKNSSHRNSNFTYELEDRISNIEKNMEQLSFITKVHDANIRYILRKNPNEGPSDVMPQIKRFKTDEESKSSKRSMVSLE